MEGDVWRGHKGSYPVCPICEKKPYFVKGLQGEYLIFCPTHDFFKMAVDRYLCRTCLGLFRIEDIRSIEELEEDHCLECSKGISR